MTRALTVKEVLKQKKKTFAFKGKWKDAFGEPERTGVWFIWGKSGNGKTSFVMQLCKQLCEFDRVAYNSLEEGDSLTMQNTLKRYGMNEVNKSFYLLNGENMRELSDRLDKRKSVNIVVIDSFQYTQMNYKEYIRFKEAHKDKLIIFISHAAFCLRTVGKGYPILGCRCFLLVGLWVSPVIVVASAAGKCETCHCC